MERYKEYRPYRLKTALPPIKTTIAAFTMLVAGVVLSMGAIGEVYVAGDHRRAIGLAILGGMMFIPGSYASYVIYGSYHRWPGFSYDQLPSYDED